MPKRRNAPSASRDESAAPALPARPIWSGTISFGLVSIPVHLLPAVREGRVPLRLLDEGGATLSRRYFNPKTGREIHSEHIVRGYEYAPEQFIVVHEDELEALEPEKSRDIDLQRFVDVKQLDPVYFQRAYFMLPAGESTKAYRLLVEAMEESDRAGIATFVMRDKEYLVAIIAENGVLRAQTMRFHDEIRSPQDVGLPERDKAPKREVDAVSKAIRSRISRSFDPASLVDEHRQKMLQLIASKQEARKDIVESPNVSADEESDEPSVRSFMAALQNSLEQAKRKQKGRSRSRAGRDEKGGDEESGGARGGSGRSSRAGRDDDSAAGELAGQSKDDLYERAQELDIPGRSQMTKQQLVRAIRSHGR